MLIGRVVGSLVATQQEREARRREAAPRPASRPLRAGAGRRGARHRLGVAGVGDRVLLVQDGKAAQQALGRGTAAVDAAVVGVVDDRHPRGLAMDDERIKQLTQEVLADLVRPAETELSGATDLLARIASLEAEVRFLRGGAPAGTAGPVVTAAMVVSTERPSHPSFTPPRPGAGLDGNA